MRLDVATLTGKVLGATLSGGLALEVAAAAPPPPPSIADVLWARGVLAWVAIVAFALMGSIIHWWRQQLSAELPPRRRVLASFGVSLCFGILAGVWLGGTKMAPELQAIGVAFASFAAEWGLTALEKMLGEAAANPWAMIRTFWLDARAGRALRRGGGEGGGQGS